MIRIGLGKDLHRLVEGRPFIVGGITIPSDKGELGHSDGDVLCHAIIDALLGASGLGDIGEFFPPSDLQWKNADSMELLKKSVELVYQKGWKVINIDCVLTCESPKLLPYRQSIRESLAKALQITVDRIFVKGKTNERVDAIGAGMAVEALAVCLLEHAQF
ncbi:2-C-methyl-D-erythritol 2,4-cyclodiphosphate synthase [Gracilinema caldarium]|uniref:2-C-methyl-D-erythritol 2,4-cyclodiphosphate synthase n=1 Tax=Gracilinema caldarium (strain ATCC 51460 / DSM 7334 / H1) TaxID=744872 RepID=F8F0U7_GRAC1|nr:2-C-methyl-D-erythritol 2,4-cyclodiphosphate synthase [Gracilinema caldarium]AEJ20233.1 2-C-methyl-D-erythritol 2,4-cyclodiphosphate synthase [Gracilinema caldarium DSM 7334]